MPTFKYVTDKDSYLTRYVPRQGGNVREHLFYSMAEDLPVAVPHGCNPRNQNINAKIYQKVAESFKDVDDMTFHLKNKGITVLSTGVNREEKKGKVYLTVQVPDELGNVDGQHTHEIVTTYAKDNPQQLVHIRILENLPEVMISPVAAGLNTSVQVTNATMADHYGLFSDVRKVLVDYEYAEWIGYRQNDKNISAQSKDLVTLMWICNPTLFSDNSSWHPSWIYSRSGSVYDKFFNEKEEDFRRKLLSMAHVLPDIIEMYRHVNETVTSWLTKRRTKRTPTADVYGRKEKEISIDDLCESKIGFPFRDPSDMVKHQQLRECYRLIIVSGLRSLMELDPKTGFVEWSIDYDLVPELLDKALKPIYKQLVLQLRHDKRNHGLTQRQPSVWTIPYTEMRNIYANDYKSLPRRDKSPAPHAKRSSGRLSPIDLAMRATHSN